MKELFVYEIEGKTPLKGPNPLRPRQRRIMNGSSNLTIATLTVDRLEWVTPEMFRRIADALSREAERLERRNSA